MKVYLRKIDEQCINKQISYPKEILREFLGNLNDHDVIKCEGVTSHQKENVALLLATDPRFDNSIKHVLNAEGTLEVGDIMVMYKNKNNYLVELVKPTSSKHSSFAAMFASTDRHLLINASDDLSSTIVGDAEILKEEYKKWLKTAKKSNGENYSDKVQSNYVWGVGKASELLGVDIYSIYRASDLYNTIDSFLLNDELMEKDKNESNNTISNGLRVYKRFFNDFFGISTISEKEDSTMDELEEKIKQCWNEKSFHYVEVQPLYDEFNSMFGVDVIRAFSDDECLDKLFGRVSDNSLVYNLEHVSKFDYFAHVGGYRTIYTLYEKDDEWKYCTSGKNVKNITREEAIKIAVDYRNAFVEFFDFINSLKATAEITTKGQFELIEKKAKDCLGILYGRNWVWKYCHMLFPDLFTTFFSDKWINKIFRVAKIVPESSYIIQCYQFSSFARKLGLLIVYVYHILEELDDAEDELEEIDEEDVVETDSMVKKLGNRSPRTIKKYPLNAIFYGAPGTGKTYATAAYALAVINNKDLSEYDGVDRKDIMNQYKLLVEQGKIVFTTFHQNYSYEDFIQGLRPTTKDGQMEFVPVDGVFKKIADVAIKDNNSNYVIIIDEINRANISKVLGELITLIEDDKRWGEINELSVTLPSGDDFAVPNNLYIVGTMNTADKSISIIDVALRRRFDFIEQEVDLSKVSDAKLKKVLNTINEELKKDLDSTDLLIGHAYFMNKTEADLMDLMNRNVIPLLYEYYFDNSKKVLSLVKAAIADTDLVIDDKAQGRVKVKKGA